MTQISIPDDLYHDLKRAAVTANRPVARLVEEYLRDALDAPWAKLTSGEQDELAAMNHLSDDGLVAIARSVLAAPMQTRIAELLEINNRGSLSATEHSEMEALLERGDRLMLRKAQALALLQRRGIRLNLREADN